ncbi:Proteasome assembly chaperone 2 [Anthophora quadrimaculata]
MIKIPEEINLENYTLIIPSVAVGNVGQLCTDLLIYNLNLTKVGSMWNPAFLPICGLDPYNRDSKSLCTTADFYLGTNYQIIVLHIRAPHIGHLNDFFDEVAQFTKQKKISKIIILTSSYDYECADKSDSSLRYLTTDNALLSNKKLLESFTWKKHMKKTLTESVEQHYIPGGGFANGFYHYLKSVEIPCTVLFCYCSEGDNIPDAFILFEGLNEWLNLLKDNTDCDIKYPPSWEYLFGNLPPLVIY